FAGALQSLGDQAPIVVTASDGTVVSDGDPDVDGQHVRQALASSLPDGEYQVAYRVVSADGHLVTGATRFFVGSVPPAPDQTPESSPAGRADGSPDPGGDAAEQGDGVPGAVLAVVGGIAVLVVAVLVLRRNRDRQQP
ncbi:MAG: copper resistance protein CopC, partial [Actinomycetes bacterium]